MPWSNEHVLDGTYGFEDDQPVFTFDTCFDYKISLETLISSFRSNEQGDAKFRGVRISLEGERQLHIEVEIFVTMIGQVYTAYESDDRQQVLYYEYPEWYGECVVTDMMFVDADRLKFDPKPGAMIRGRFFIETGDPRTPEFEMGYFQFIGKPPQISPPNSTESL